MSKLIQFNLEMLISIRTVQ